MVMVVVNAYFVVMPVSVTDPNADATDLDVVRDDYRLVAGARRTGECRHCQKRNEKNSKRNVLHGTLVGWELVKSRWTHDARLVLSTSVLN